MQNKYKPGTPINSRKYGTLTKVHQVLKGEMVLEVPDTNKTSRKLKHFEKLAASRGIRIKFAKE
jgi:hypothetical protein